MNTSEGFIRRPIATSLLMAATFLVFTISIGQAGRGRFPLSLEILAGFALLSALLAIAAVLPASGRARRRRRTATSCSSASSRR